LEGANKARGCTESPAWHLFKTRTSRFSFVFITQAATQSESPLIPTLYSSLSSLHSTLTLQSWHLGALSTSVVCLQLLCLRPARPQLLRLCQIPRQSVCQHVKSSQRRSQERVESRLQGSVQSRLPKRVQRRFLGKVQKSQPLQR